MKIIMIYDQIQSGLGTKDDTMVPLTGKKEPIGPAVMMEPFLKQVDGHVIACLCCGNGTYLADPEEVSRKLCAMVKKLQPCAQRLPVTSTQIPMQRHLQPCPWKMRKPLRPTRIR